MGATTTVITLLATTSVSMLDFPDALGFTFECVGGYYIPIWSWIFGLVGQVCTMVPWF